MGCETEEHYFKLFSPCGQDTLCNEGTCISEDRIVDDELPRLENLSAAQFAISTLDRRSVLR